MIDFETYRTKACKALLKAGAKQLTQEQKQHSVSYLNFPHRVFLLHGVCGVHVSYGMYIPGGLLDPNELTTIKKSFYSQIHKHINI